MSIYETVGGAPAFDRLAHALHERCVADPMLNHPFDRPDLKPDHLPRLAAYLAEIAGGPQTYSGEYGGHSAMHEVHACNEAPEEMFVAFAACFGLALDDAGFPTDVHPALQSTVDKVLTEMHAYMTHDSVVPPSLPMPHA